MRRNNNNDKESIIRRPMEIGEEKRDLMKRFGVGEIFGMEGENKKNNSNNINNNNNRINKINIKIKLIEVQVGMDEDSANKKSEDDGKTGTEDDGKSGDALEADEDVV